MIAERAADLIRFGPTESAQDYYLDEDRWQEELTQQVQEPDQPAQLIEPPLVMGDHYKEGAMEQYNLTRFAPKYYEQLAKSLKKHHETSKRFRAPAQWRNQTDSRRTQVGEHPPGQVALSK